MPILAVLILASIVAVSYYLFILILAFSSEVGYVLYRHAEADLGQLLTYRSLQPSWHSSMLMLSLVVFWKGVGLRFIWVG